MTFGATFRTKFQTLAALFAALMLAFAAQAALAQDAAPLEPAVTEAAPATDGEVVADAAPAFEHYGPDMIKGQPVDGGIDFQPQYTDNGEYAYNMHTYLLMPIITVISIFVLFLLLWVMVRYNRRANQVASKTSHNTLIEVIWTVIPVLILVVIAVPSITLLSRQYKTAPEDAITIKTNGYQWYWGYEYVDNGGFEVVSNMLDESAALDAGEPHQLAVDNRMVVPVGVPIRIQTFGKDVIHSFGIPSLWFKLDAVPGRLNEKMLTIKEPGIYYGQCMELCGARHGYMPIAIEARPLDEFNAWVKTQPGGMTQAEVAAEKAAAAAPAPAAEAEEEGAAAEEENAEVAASEAA